MEIGKGIHLIYKPAGHTSHDIVDKVRKLSGERRVGHAGTLDPFAEGLLIVLVGKQYTKRQSEFLGMDKSYDATIMLGGWSNTDDYTGEITPHPCLEKPSDNEVKQVLDSFVGTFGQMPPVFSAKKIGGKKAYELARKGITPELTAKEITVNSIELIDFTWPEIKIRCSVSSGTYIRALARDIGEALGCGGYLSKLKRTSIGSYGVGDAIR